MLPYCRYRAYQLRRKKKNSRPNCSTPATATASSESLPWPDEGGNTARSAGQLSRGNAMKIIPTLLAAFAMAAPGVAAVQAQEADYPNRAVTIVVPYQAGGVADALPRMVGEKLGKKWNVPVIIK